MQVKSFFVAKFKIFFFAFLCLCNSIVAQKLESTHFDFQHELILVDSLLKTNINAAKEKTDILIERYSESDSVVWLAKALLKSGQANELSGDYTTAKNKLYQSNRIFKKLYLYHEQAKTYSILGVVFENEGRYDSALICYQKSLELNDSLGNIKGSAKSYLDIGVTYLRQSDLDKAKTFFYKTSKLSRSINDLNMLAAVYNNLGIVYDIEGKNDSSFIFYTKAIELQKILGNDRELSKLYHNVSLASSFLGDYENAKIKLHHSIKIKKRIGDLHGLSNSYYVLAKILHENNETDGAQKYLDIAYQTAFDKDFIFILQRVYELQSSIFESRNQYSKALEYHKKYKFISDSLQDLTLNNQILKLRSSFEIKEKEKENIILKQENDINAGKLEKQKIKFELIVLIAISVFFALILVFTLYRSKLKLLNTTKLIYEKEKSLKNLELEKKEHENKFLMMERKQSETEQQIIRKEFEHKQKLAVVEKEKFENYLQSKNNELISLVSQTISNNEILYKIKRKISEIIQKSNGSQVKLNDLLKEVNKSLDPELYLKKIEIDLDNFYPGFLDRLRLKYSDLTINDQRLCAYLLIGLSSKEIANTLNITISGIHKSRQRLRKKLNIDSKINIPEYLKTI